MISNELVTTAHPLCFPTRMWAPPFLWAMVPVQKHSPRLARESNIFQKGGFKHVEAENEEYFMLKIIVQDNRLKSPILKIPDFLIFLS